MVTAALQVAVNSFHIIADDRHHICEILCISLGTDGFVPGYHRQYCQQIDGAFNAKRKSMRACRCVQNLNVKLHNQRNPDASTLGDDLFFPNPLMALKYVTIISVLIFLFGL